MDFIIAFLGGPDGFVAFITLLGSAFRSRNGERVPVVQGLLSTLVSFFVVLMIIWLLEYAVGLSGRMLPPKPLAGLGGLFGFLGNYWIAGLQRNGRLIARGGAAESLLKIIKTVTNLKNT